MIERITETNSDKTYPAELRSFARCLHALSPKAYKYVRESFFKSLPCEKTIFNWACSRNYQPGILSECVDAIANKVTKELRDFNRNLVFCLIFDEMHIKKQFFWDRKAGVWKGIVDTGGQLNEQSFTGEHLVASKALVFMVVNLSKGSGCLLSY